MGRKPWNIPCKGHTIFNPDGIEYECGYGVDFECTECILNGGSISPLTNKPFRGNLEYRQQVARERWEKSETKKILDTL